MDSTEKTEDESSTDQEWTDEYERGYVVSIKHSPESPTTRGERNLATLWSSIRPGIVDRFPDDEVPVDVPKDVLKWAALPDWVELMNKHPHSHRNVFDWLDSWVPKGGTTLRGVLKLRRVKENRVARTKQSGSGVNNPKPAFAFFGNRIPFTETYHRALQLVKKLTGDGSYPDPDVAKLDAESLQSWYSVMGGRCSTYVFAESFMLFHGMTPHQETPFPVPHDILQDSWDKVFDREFHNYTGQTTLHPTALFVGTSVSGGIYIANREGAAGWPYINMMGSEIAGIAGSKAETLRPTKGNMFPDALRTLVEWIEGGMPMKGELYRAVAQPATLAYRGDRPVNLDVRKWATHGPDTAYHPTSSRLAAVLPGRSIIVVPTVQILAQSTWAQPLGNLVSEVAVPGFDWVDPDHTVRRLDNVRRADLEQGDTRGPMASVGADASGWDRDVVAQDHASETALYLAMFPEEVELLYIDTPLPVDVNKEFVTSLTRELSAGGTKELKLTGLDNRGGEHIVTGTARVIHFDYHDFICKVMTMVNDAPLTWGDYVGDARGVLAQVPGARRWSSRPRWVVSNGGRRSGDAITGLGNTWTNLVISEAAASMSRDPALATLCARRASLLGTEPTRAHVLIDDFARGDDRATVVLLLKGGVPSEVIAGGLAAVGRRANAKKQEASDIPGKPVFAFANVLVTERYMGKMLGRTWLRYMVQETAGISKEMLDAVRDEGSDLGVSDLLIATTGTAKAKLAPLAGFPLMSEHPGAFTVVKWAVTRDKYRLAYLSDGSFDDQGEVTDEARVLTRRAADVEARAQARLRAKRENVSVDLERLKEVYAGSTVHDMVESVAFDTEYRPSDESEVDNAALFMEAVSSGGVLEL